MNPNEENIQRLLRMKRYEKPDEEFTENFLREFQRRQRLESMKPSLWEVLSDKVSGMFPEIRVPAYAYATVGLFAVGMSAWILSSEEIGVQQGGMASAGKSANEMVLDLSSPVPTALPHSVTIPNQRLVGSLPPHYVLQSSPSAENEPYSF